MQLKLGSYFVQIGLPLIMKSKDRLNTNSQRFNKPKSECCNISKKKRHKQKPHNQKPMIFLTAHRLT